MPAAIPGGPYRAICNKNAVHLDPDLRKALLQLLSGGPVRRRTPMASGTSYGAICAQLMVLGGGVGLLVPSLTSTLLSSVE
jgi:hypothetical protein